MSDNEYSLSSLLYLLNSIIAQINVAASAMTDPNITEPSTQATGSTLLLGLTGSGWDLGLIASVILAALAGIAVGVTTAGSIISHKRENEQAARELAIYQAGAAAEVARAQADAAHANERTADLEKAAEEARERTAQAEKEISETSLNLARMRAPRVITPEQKDFLIAKLQGFQKVSYDAAADVGDAEARALLLSLMSAFEQAGWTGRNWLGPGLKRKIAPYPSFGDITAENVILLIDEKSSDDVQSASATLLLELSADDIPCEIELLSTDQLQAQYGADDIDTIHVLVGKKAM